MPSTMHRSLLRLTLPVWLGLLCGCHAPAVTIEHESIRLAVRDEVEMDALWAATLDVLRRHRFQVDRRDLTAGVITTFPETSGHWFEVWRRDTATPYDTLESNLQTIRREVTVNIAPGDDPESRTLAVKVAKQRLTAEQRQVTNPISGRRVFSEGVPTTSGNLRTRKQSVEWVDLGRDAHFERAIMDRVIAMYGPATHEYVAEAAEPSLNPQRPAQGER